MILQKFKKNEIIKAIQTAHLDPREFVLGEKENEAWIKHKPSNAYFTISGSPLKYIGQYVYGDWPLSSYEKYSWEGVMTSVRTWLYSVKQDLETPDLWAELQKEVELLEPIYNKDTENTLFTSQEKKEIAELLNEFAEQAQDIYSLSETQMISLNEKLDYIIKATDHLGRLDWVNVVVGVIVGYVLVAALPPEAARGMFFILLRSISHLYGLHVISP